MATAGEAAHAARVAGAVQKFAELARLLEVVDARWFGDRTDPPGLRRAVTPAPLLEPFGRPPRIVEIGSYLGGTLAAWRAMWPAALVVSVDLPDPPERELVAYGAVTITADSHDPRTVELVETALGGLNPDLVFIDGDHSEEGCRRDVEDYGGLLDTGGLLALHDVAPYFPSAGAEPLGPELVWRGLDRWATSLALVGTHLEAVPMWERLGEIIDRGPSIDQPEEWAGIGLAVRR